MWSRITGSRLGRTSKRLVCIPFVLMAKLCLADLTENDVETTWFGGKIFTFPMPNPTSVTSGEGGGAMNMIPVSFYLNRKANIEFPGGFTTSILYEQIKVYVPGTNQFVPITPRSIYVLSTAVSKSAGSDSGTNAADDYAASGFLRTLRTAPYNTPEYQFGKYRFVVRVLPSGGSWATALSLEFVMSPIGLRDWANGGGGDPLNPGSGGGVTPDDLNGQPINQTGFWHDIFLGLLIPQEENLNVLRDTIMQFGSWGPFGIISAIRTRAEAYAEGEKLDYVFTVDLPFAGPTEIDFTAYETWIKIGRTVAGMSLWIGFVWMMKRRVFDKV